MQTTLNEKKEARVNDRVMELLLDVQRRAFTWVNPGKIVESFKLGDGDPPALGIRTSEIVDGFYSFLGFPGRLSSTAIQMAVAAGIKDRLFGYCCGAAPALGGDGKYQVRLSRVRFDASVGEDEIDLESGFLMMPESTPAESSPGEEELPILPARPRVVRAKKRRWFSPRRRVQRAVQQDLQLRCRQRGEVRGIQLLR